MSFGLLLGRLAGFGRDMTVASAFGVSKESDLVILMLTVPDLLVNILVGGALSAALLPQFKKLSNSDSHILFVQSSLILGGGFIVITAILYALVDVLVNFLAPGFDTQTASQASGLLKSVLWLIPLTVLSGVSTAYLHSKEKFAIASLGTLIFNLSVIVGLILLISLGFSLATLAVFVILGGLIRWGSQLVFCELSKGRGGRLNKNIVDRSLVKRYFQAMLSGGFLLLFPVFARSLATYSGDGALSSLNFALKLVEFPLAISITVLSVVLFPALSERYASKNASEYLSLARNGFLITLLLSLATMVPLIIFNADFVALAFGYGKMTEPALDEISSLVAIGFILLPLQGCTTLLMTLFNSRLDTKTPMYINFLGLILFFILGVYLDNIYGLMGVMYALLVSHIFIFITSLTLLACKHGLAISTSLIDPGGIRSIVVLLVTLSSLSYMLTLMSFNVVLNSIFACLIGGTALLFVALFDSRSRFRMFHFLSKDNVND